MKDATRMTTRRVFNSSVADSPTFPEFVEYLIRTPPNLMDKHWAPFTKVKVTETLGSSSICPPQVCLPCNLTYSAILKLDTLKQDADWLFSKLGLENIREDWDQVAGINKGRVHGGPGGSGGLSSEELAAKYFGQLSKKAVVQLYNKFLVDFQMFDYDNQVEKFIEMAGKR